MATGVDRLTEYAALVEELQNRYSDLHQAKRWSFLMTACIALADAASVVDRGKRVSEEEFVALVRRQFRKVRG